MLGLRDDEGEPVAGRPHECVVTRCGVTERQARVRSVPAAGGSVYDAYDYRQVRGGARTIQRRNLTYFTTNTNLPV